MPTLRNIVCVFHLHRRVGVIYKCGWVCWNILPQHTQPQVYFIPVAYWGGFRRFNLPSSKFRSFDKTEPNSQFRGKYIHNNQITIRFNSFANWVEPLTSGLPPPDPFLSALCPLLNLLTPLPAKRSLRYATDSYLPTYEDGTEMVFRNVGIETTNAPQSPKPKHTTYITFTPSAWSQTLYCH
jgi:hypothetical protein